MKGTTFCKSFDVFMAIELRSSMFKKTYTCLQIFVALGNSVKL